MSWLGVPFSSAEVDTPEDLDSPLAADPRALAEHLAAEKASEARALGLGADSLIACFDTIVVHDGEILGKPIDLDDAWRMLRSLSGREHQVVTGCALVCPDGSTRVFSVTTDVVMKQLDDDGIRAWMAHGEFMGCAGAYNIEGQVAEVSLDECHQNVAGLPLCHLYAELTGPQIAGCLGSTPRSPVVPCDAALGRCCRLGPSVTGTAGCVGDDATGDDGS